MIFAQSPGPGSVRCAPDPDRLLGFIESRLDRHLRYRQRLAKTPIERWPVWIGDPDFDLRRHVRYERFGPGSSETSLQDRCAVFLAEPMDLDHPLWAILVLEGFAKDRFALVVKAHHCMVDGIEGVELLRSMLDVEVRSEFERAPLRPLESKPSWGSLALSNGIDRTRAFIDFTRAALAAASRPAEAIDRFVDQSLGAAAHPGARPEAEASDCARRSNGTRAQHRVDGNRSEPLPRDPEASRRDDQRRRSGHSLAGPGTISRDQWSSPRGPGDDGASCGDSRRQAGHPRPGRGREPHFADVCATPDRRNATLSPSSTRPG